MSLCGEVAEWLMAADCKSALERVHRFKSYPHHHLLTQFDTLAALPLTRQTAFQAERKKLEAALRFFLTSYFRFALQTKGEAKNF